MKAIRLSPRLMAVAELVPENAAVIDVGTDHAMIPVWLAQTGRASHIIASDIRPGPLESAARLVRETGTEDRITLHMTDGLQGFSRADADTVILAGMGGETMISILSAAPWVKDGVVLILEPQSKQHLLRRWLAENGFDVKTEKIVRDAGRIYSVLMASAGESPCYTEAEYHIGLWEIIGSDPLLPEHLASLKKRVANAAPYDPSAEKLLEEFTILEKRLKT